METNVKQMASKSTDWNIISILSTACIFFGIGLTFAYGSTFLTTSYNEIYLAGESGLDETDLPYTLAIIECVISGMTLLVGLLAVAVPRKIDRNVITIALVYFLVATVTESILLTTRLSSLGMFGEIAKTCGDPNTATGCPTTRFEAKHDRSILYTSPLGGDCQFFYWDEMRTRYQPGSPCQLTTPSDSATTICDSNIQNFMDWSSPKSYGWRDDPRAIENLNEADELTSVDKIHNVAELDVLQTLYNDSISEKFETQPAIAYCYYWGCNSVCNSHRYLVNQQWMFSSIVLLITHVAFAGSAALICRRAESLDDFKPVLVQNIPYATATVTVKDPEALYLDIPDMGRRKRRLTPGLKF